MKNKFKNLLILILFTLIPTFLIWLPYYLRLPSFWNIPLPQNGMATIVANYDGPLYIVVAKSFYNPDQIKNFAFNLPVQYYAAHFPLFPILIKIFSSILGYPYSMLFVTVSSSVLALIFFYKFICLYVEKKDVLWISFVFSIFPARWLIIRSVGSPEPLFIALIIASIYFFKKEKYFVSSIFASLATFTKSPGILLFPAFILTYLSPNLKNIINVKRENLLKALKISKILPTFLIPLSLLIVFIVFKIRLEDFFAYFHSGDNIHLMFPPFSIFNYSSTWVGTFWLEEIIFIYLFGILALLKIIKNKDNLSWFFGIFFLTTLFIAHRDLLRYSLPLVPFTFAAFSNLMVKKEFKIALLVIIIPIYLFSIAFISNNVMPIGDWGPLL